MNLNEGSPPAIALETWLESGEGKRCTEGANTGEYSNRCQIAYLSGWDDCERVLVGRIHSLLAEGKLRFHRNGKFLACGSEFFSLKEAIQTLDRVQVR